MKTKLRPNETQKVAALVGHFGTQAELAKKLGVHNTTVNHWLSGKTGWWKSNSKKVKELYKDTFGTPLPPKKVPTQLELDLQSFAPEPRPPAEPTEADVVIEIALANPKDFELAIVDRRITGVMFKN